MMWCGTATMAFLEISNPQLMTCIRSEYVFSQWDVMIYTQTYHDKQVLGGHYASSITEAVAGRNKNSPRATQILQIKWATNTTILPVASSLQMLSLVLSGYLVLSRACDYHKFPCTSNKCIERQDVEAVCGQFVHKAKQACPEDTFFFTYIVSPKEVYDLLIVHGSKTGHLWQMPRDAQHLWEPHRQRQIE